MGPVLSDTAVTKFHGKLPQQGVKYGGFENLRFSTEIAVFLGNGKIHVIDQWLLWITDH